MSPEGVDAVTATFLSKIFSDFLLPKSDSWPNVCFRAASIGLVSYLLWYRASWIYLMGRDSWPLRRVKAFSLNFSNSSMQSLIVHPFTPTARAIIPPALGYNVNELSRME